MAKRGIRPDAEDDLGSIWSFIAADNPRAADATIDRLFDTFDMLLTMPKQVVRVRSLARMFAASRSTILWSIM
jgi:plasmid stabilization system protein ParE